MRIVSNQNNINHYEKRRDNGHHLLGLLPLLLQHPLSLSTCPAGLMFAEITCYDFAESVYSKQT